MTKLSRRDFLKRTACVCGGALAWGVVPGLGLKNAFAGQGNGTKLLFVNLNGGLDGLAALQPVSGALYTELAALRPTLAKAPNTLLATDGRFGLHPNLGIFKSLYDEGKLAAVLNVGYENMSRSHLEAEVAYARGVSDRTIQSTGGFINRMGTEFGWSSMQAVSISGSDLAFEGGGYRGTQVNGLENFYFHGDFTQNTSENNFRRDMIYSVSQDTPQSGDRPATGEIVNGIEISVNNSQTMRTAMQQTTFPSSYTSSYLGRQFRDVEILFSNSSIGAQVAYMRRTGFDTHSSQAQNLNALTQEFNTAFTTFVGNMKSKGLWNNLIIVIFSEFGRTNRENGSGGTDHGGAITLFLSGGAVNGGIYGDTLVSDLTQNGWLPMRYNIVEVHRRILARMDFDPNRVFGSVTGPSLPGLFT